MLLQWDPKARGGLIPQTPCLSTYGWLPPKDPEVIPFTSSPPPSPALKLSSQDQESFPPPPPFVFEGNIPSLLSAGGTKCSLNCSKSLKNTKNNFGHFFRTFWFFPPKFFEKGVFFDAISSFGRGAQSSIEAPCHSAAVEIIQIFTTVYSLGGYGFTFFAFRIFSVPPVEEEKEDHQEIEADVLVSRPLFPFLFPFPQRKKGERGRKNTLTNGPPFLIGRKEG